MKKIVFYSSLCLILGACASMVDHQTVNMTVRTPGAENAKCFIENEDHKYVAYSNDTVEVMKSPHDLVVSCMAPGNRQQTVHVKREINGWVVANVANGFVPGAAYDYFSRGGFDYPDVVSVNFSGQAVKPYALPDYETRDLSGGQHRGKIEDHGPSEMMKEGDRYEEPYILLKKTDVYTNSSFDSYQPATTTYQASRPAVSYDPTEEDK